MMRMLVVAALSLSIATSAGAQFLENARGEARADDRAVGADKHDQETPTAASALPAPRDCPLPSETWGIPRALDAAITGPADRDRACLKALLTPDARIVLVSLAADGSPSYKVLRLDDWIARTKARGHVTIEEKQLNFRVDRFGNIAHVWSMYALHSDGTAVARGINSIQAIRESAGWRIAEIMVQAEWPAAPLPEGYVP